MRHGAVVLLFASFAGCSTPSDIEVVHIPPPP